VIGTLTRRPYAAGFAALVGLVGLALVVLAFTRPPAPPRPPGVSPDASRVTTSPSTAPPARGRTPSTAGHGGIEDPLTGPVLSAARPLRLSIPRLHVATPLVRLGQDARGAMEVPADPATAGWYHLGPSPGALGPAVIAGHVTWNQQPAVFFRLADLRRGDAVEVVRDDERVARFDVTAVRTYAKSDFATRAVFGGIDHAGLRLITCGGDFDASAHRYSDNVVVFARLVSTHPRRSRG
jgi:LPXTG-site transpeptidase (sortase) family protein